MSEPFGFDRKSTLAGSIHMLSNGYGNGVRVLTHRNQMTVPASVPAYRHLPDTARFKADTTCKVLTHFDDRAQKRNADQISKQTSGEYGQYLIQDHTRSEKLNLGRSTHQFNEKSGKFNFPVSSARSEQSTARTARSAGGSTSRSESKPFYEPMTTERYKSDLLDNVTPIELHSTSTSVMQRDRLINTGRSSLGPSSVVTGSSERDQFRSTLQNLDKSYQNRNKRDLLAATLPPRGYQEGKLCATSNHRNGENSKAWAYHLRQEKPQVAVNHSNSRDA
jgi:hypothetical protein